MLKEILKEHERVMSYAPEMTISNKDGISMADLTKTKNMIRKNTEAEILKSYIPKSEVRAMIEEARELIVVEMIEPDTKVKNRNIMNILSDLSNELEEKEGGIMKVKLNEKGQCPVCKVKPLVYKRDGMKFCLSNKLEEKK